MTQKYESFSGIKLTKKLKITVERKASWTIFTQSYRKWILDNLSELKKKINGQDVVLCTENSVDRI